MTPLDEQVRLLKRRKLVLIGVLLASGKLDGLSFIPHRNPNFIFMSEIESIA